ncbi:hypothetical protein FKW77_003475 [Venturia effusa]|uniref:Uncharacterized protein n=1 Tax=Venturia effusa TaxID=50376 RepID=A0A517LAP9_9PEZI|nr:hypothetical protein FKW77_003475 [Venturia effusa]
MASTLLEQASQKAVEELSADPKAFAERFVGYPPEEQTALLREMGKRTAKLLEAQKVCKTLTENMATADLQIHLAEMEILDPNADGARERSELATKWQWMETEPSVPGKTHVVSSYFEQCLNSPAEMGYEIIWSDQGLIAKDSREPFALCSKHEPNWGTCEWYESYLYFVLVVSAFYGR